MCARIAPIHSRWCSSKWPASASRNAGIFLRICRRASCGEHVGVGLAGDERVEHVAPDLPITSAATQSSLMPASSKALCSRLTSRARSWICVLR